MQRSPGTRLNASSLDMNVIIHCGGSGLGPLEQDCPICSTSASWAFGTPTSSWTRFLQLASAESTEPSVRVVLLQSDERRWHIVRPPTGDHLSSRSADDGGPGIRGDVLKLPTQVLGRRIVGKHALAVDPVFTSALAADQACVGPLAEPIGWHLLDGEDAVERTEFLFGLVRRRAKCRRPTGTPDRSHRRRRPGTSRGKGTGVSAERST